MTVNLPAEYKFVDLRGLAPHEEAKATSHMQVAENLHYLWSRDAAYLGGKIWDPRKTASSESTTFESLTQRSFGGLVSRFDANGDALVRVAAHVEHAAVEADIDLVSGSSTTFLGTEDAGRGSGEDWVFMDFALADTDLTVSGEIKPIRIALEWRGDGTSGNTRSIRQVAAYERAASLSASDLP